MKFLTLSWQILALCVYLCAALSPAPAVAAEQTNVTIIADASLISPLRAITQAYTRSKGIGITLIADAHHYPVRQLSEGLAADLVLTGNRTAQHKLEEMGMIDQFASRVVMYEPVVLATRDNAAVLPALSGKALGDQLLATGSVPTCVLLQGDAYPEMQPVAAILAASKLDPNPAMETVADFDALERALEQPHYFTAMPISMTRHNPQLKVFSVLGAGGKQRIKIRGEVLAGTHMKAARALLSYLTSAAAKPVWEHYGYVPAN